VTEDVAVDADAETGGADGPGGRADGYRLRRRAVVADLLAHDDALLVVAGLGAPAWDATAAGDRDRTFPLWGAMGGALAMGLGLALARPGDRVLVLTGDGELLMGVGSLSTVGFQQPANLAAVVLDNERYGETGGQVTHTARSTDLAAVAAACGWPSTRTVRQPDKAADLRTWLWDGPGPRLAVVKVSPQEDPLVLPPRDGVVLRDRFRRAVLGSPLPS
jgi:thiamine pyrophosphate-dependent acetolactate synthase large subunit-like protein